jgi:alkanesulfonate monooxygenase SsuD/methylene tetrahydromethanopterin reductase-like flavin-dependent oxidoreductase (luciferase family)
MSRMAFIGETDEEARRQVPTIKANHELLVVLVEGTETMVDGWAVDRRFEGEDRRQYRGELPTAMQVDEIYENLIMGGPERVRGIVKRYEQQGLDTLILYMTFGEPHADALRSLRLFATEVMPHFRTDRTQPAAAGAARAQ